MTSKFTAQKVVNKQQGRGQSPASFRKARLISTKTSGPDGTPVYVESHGWWEWRATQSYPWARRARNRRRNAVAKQSRKRNR